MDDLDSALRALVEQETVQGMLSDIERYEYEERLRISVCEVIELARQESISIPEVVVTNSKDPDDIASRFNDLSHSSDYSIRSVSWRIFSVALSKDQASLSTADAQDGFKKQAIYDVVDDEFESYEEIRAWFKVIDKALGGPDIELSDDTTELMEQIDNFRKLSDASQTDTIDESHNFSLFYNLAKVMLANEFSQQGMHQHDDIDAAIQDLITAGIHKISYPDGEPLILSNPLHLSDELYSQLVKKLAILYHSLSEKDND